MNKKPVENINSVFRKGLCMGCGTCEGVCPSDAIRMVKDNSVGCYFPKINENKCIKCGLCLKVCPGKSVDFDVLNHNVFGKAPEDILIGNYNGFYIGYATNDNLRYNSSSGGVVTALLLFALKSGIINGALVTKMNKENPLEPHSFIARTREEIISAMGSKYCPVPANVALKEVLNAKGKFAVVGLPCHIQGIRKAELVNKKLKEKIVLHIGLFCSHTDSFLQTKFLLNKFGIKEQEIVRIDYRGEGWPGMMSVLLKNGKKISIPFAKSIAPHNMWVYPLSRCALCYDFSAEFADVSCGDAWLPEVKSCEKIGKSIVITRTETGKMLCTSALKSKHIIMEKISHSTIERWKHSTQAKKRSIKVVFFLRKMFRKDIPNYNTQLMRPRFIDYLRAIFVCFNAYILSNKYLCRFVEILFYMELFVVQLFLREER